MAELEDVPLSALVARRVHALLPGAAAVCVLSCDGGWNLGSLVELVRRGAEKRMGSPAAATAAHGYSAHAQLGVSSNSGDAVVASDELVGVSVSERERNKNNASSSNLGDIGGDTNAAAVLAALLNNPLLPTSQTTANSNSNNSGGGSCAYSGLNSAVDGDLTLAYDAEAAATAPVANARHRELLTECAAALDQFLSGCATPSHAHPSAAHGHSAGAYSHFAGLGRPQRAGVPRDLVLATDHLRTAARALGKITGAVETEELLDVIFNDFCIGK